MSSFPTFIMRNVAATGTTVADAKALDMYVSVAEITSGATNSGVALPFQATNAARRIQLWNKSANTIRIYATDGSGVTGAATIDGAAFATLTGNGTATEVVHFFGHQWFTVF